MFPIQEAARETTKLLTVFDWPGRIQVTMEQILMFGGMVFAIDMDCGFSGAEIVDFLHAEGIDTHAEYAWGEENLYIFAVEKEDIKRAAQILDKNHVPYFYHHRTGPPLL